MRIFSLILFLVIALTLSLAISALPDTNPGSDPDDSIVDCTNVGGVWFETWLSSFSGEPKCCGDDHGENAIIKKWSYGSGINSNPSIAACCNQQSDCVGEGSNPPSTTSCYNSGYLHWDKVWLCSDSVWFYCGAQTKCSSRSNMKCYEYSAGSFNWMQNEPSEKCDGVDNNCNNQVDEGCQDPNTDPQICSSQGGVWLKPWEGDLGAGMEPYCCGDSNTEHYNQKRFYDDPANGVMGQGIFACCDRVNDCVGEGSPAPSDSLCYSQGFILGASGNHPNTEYICESNIWYGCNSYFICNTRLGKTCVFLNNVYKWADSSSLNEDCNDGKDNDCDGKIDSNDPDCQEQGCIPGQTKQCGLTDVGECEYGTQTCTQQGTWGPCIGAVYPVPEDCNDGKDNDCDGKIDSNDPDCQEHGCIPGQTKQCGLTDVGECEYGTQTCTQQGTWGPCIGAVYPTQETCDNKDNDCDGSIDEGNVCGNIVCVDNDNDGYNVSVVTNNFYTNFKPKNNQNSRPVCGNGVCEYGEDECIPRYCIPGTNLCFVREFCGFLCPEDCTAQPPQPPQVNCGPVDCNDNNPNVHPGAIELCNGIDDDCDGIIDEGCVYNTAPTITVDLTPNFPTDNDNLVCKGNAFDKEGNHVYANVLIEIQRNSQRIIFYQNTIDCNYECLVTVPASQTQNNDIVTCTMTPYDGYLYGQPDSDTVTIGQQCVPSTEICNYQDDDCDGKIDEDLQNCQCSEYPAVVLEGMCINDNSCPDNYRCVRDNTLNLLFGKCVYKLVTIDDKNPICGGYANAQCRQGFTCYPVPNSDAGVCFAITYSPSPSPEICDGIDNDCDGLIDEGGVCEVCIPYYVIFDYNNDLVLNESDVLILLNIVVTNNTCPTNKVCDINGNGQITAYDAWLLREIYLGNHDYGEYCEDNVDNNCNGQINEGCNQTCIPGQTKQCGLTNVGECEYGTQTCTQQGTWGSCIGAVYPTQEICDNKDNDCDGSTDEGGVCGNCGDSIIQIGEQCDNNNWGPITGCQDFGFSGGILSCNSNCQFDTSLCTGVPGYCGDNVINPGEQCDNNNWGPITGCQDFDDFIGGTLVCTQCMFNTNGCYGGQGCIDNDNDGYAINGGFCGPVDCNDNNPNVHPGAIEICNGIDDDCDGVIDEGCIYPQCTVSIEADEYRGKVPLIVHFTSEVQGTPPFTYEWTFERKATAFIPEPTYNFRDVGVKEVTLRVKTADNAVCSDTAYINVEKSEESSLASTLFIKHLILDEPVEAGKDMRVLISLQNKGTKDIEDLEIALVNQDMPNKHAFFRMDIEAGDEVTKYMYFEIPKETKPGIYDLKVTIQNKDIRRVVYREFMVKKTSHEESPNIEVYHYIFWPPSWFK